MIILTSGCSFTQYKWPTWANYLKAWSEDTQPLRVVNVGDAGIDNSIIAYRVIDYLNNRMPMDRYEYEHDPKDVEKVCIMWTGHERYCPQYKDIVTHKDIRYVRKHFHPTERLRNLAMCIDTINLLCKTKNIECYNFFYFEFTHEERKYLELMTTESWNLNHTAFSTFRSNNEPVDGNDIHPTPIDQWIFARDVVAPAIGLYDWNKRFSSRLPKIVKEHERLVRSAETWNKKIEIKDQTDVESIDSMQNYSHHDKPAHINLHMDPFATNLLNIDANSTAVTNTKTAFHDLNAKGFDGKKDNNWFDSLMERLYNL